MPVSAAICLLDTACWTQIGADLLTESAMQLSGDWWAHTACYATAFIRWPCARSHIESGFAAQSMSDMGFIVN